MATEDRSYIMANELFGDEIADIAVADPEQAAQLVAAVAPDRPETSTALAPTEQPAPAQPAAFLASLPPTVTEQVIPAAVIAVLLLQVFTARRLPRLLQAVLGTALVATFVSRPPKA